MMIDYLFPSIPLQNLLLPLLSTFEYVVTQAVTAYKVSSQNGQKTQPAPSSLSISGGRPG